MINKAVLVGNLGRDPEVHTTKSGKKVVNLNVATTKRRKDKDENWTDHTEWHRVTLFGNNAENAEKFLKKGRQVYIEGKISTQKYKDESGNDRYSTSIIADIVKFLGGKQEGGERPNLATSDNNKASSSNFDDDIPF